MSKSISGPGAGHKGVRSGAAEEVGAKDGGSDAWIAIGELARRSGVPASALRFYEERGLIAGGRSAAGRRQYPRHVLRRVGFIRAAQAVGLALDEIAAALASLPEGRTPTKADWQRLSAGWAPLLDARIAALTRLRDQLGACIGCGCLSLKSCRLYNPLDRASLRGSGPRYLLGDKPVSG
ncbi:redox-sensitive transcriptional activator SoxR [Kinneretia asaccharophila]|uniref:MerR family redox-sensitive transcriptional activator SoxR n=1 Tax=Roseateles asaccharophilus TaxID=582607 RepID=A0A4R6NAR2_9BURK|nr:redox-sensitive transcriptional activator SoxR [Roseateles asaccharophilus]MDN3545044.1 redox-sensitive transcriptional activator SoxR [Roseateles asaccharophilus]TDP12570.1 MerR family redox-sensitive transcriptional activator SoxR [Roseateles asaccharophilus]